MAEFKLHSWSARNPLAIIALFISLIYGMSALLLGTSVENLTTQNQTVLVIFIVGFPVVVLTVFTWLVSQHHTKLYGPSDFRSDKSFLDAGRNAPSEEVGKRLEAELASDSPIEKSDSSPEQAATSLEIRKTPEEKVEGIIFAKGVARSQQLSKAFLAESLVFQALQSEFGGSIRREVVVSGVHIDGLIYTPDGSVVIVEVKIFSDRYAEVFRRIRDARSFLQSAEVALQREGIVGAKSLLAIVIDGNTGRLSELRSKLQNYSREEDPIQIRMFGLQELISQFGLAEKS
ncbi:hypothetical protein [Pseudorhodoplanes sinuspersici]|uniref:Uncharacterized protein n=1 Tax=Pseudorhodoplanes sinuspersici TaxID=1235591 RepID=A0A1W6ZW20_9HYPH|nr:hypothetical protein [Pseudorhodoplanes sinuspersici]ARQ01510.1 hypothetical protein CAK95_22175 [Pseudorhodoplanes sinuspersici]RKE73211.1 hypothetical protein DFP91_1091 [Pseudorhodoplanes sinuspersici]